MDAVFPPPNPAPPRLKVRGATLDETAAALRAAGVLDDAPKLAESVYHGIHRDGGASIVGIAGTSAKKLAAAAAVLDDGELELVECVESWDKSARYVFRCPDGSLVESVRIHHHGLWTVCVSSQAGCALACRFCATGMIGLKRDLEAWEIVDQVHQVARRSGVRVSDIVFMGMGEPLMNETQVYRAAAIMSEPHGLQISPKRITISTAGVVPAIHRFIDEKRPYRLVFSLGTAVPEKRLKLMPVTQKWDFDAFVGAVRRYEEYRKRKHVTLEYVAIRNLTMGEDDEAALQALHDSGLRFILNVIPLNPVGNELEGPSMVETREWTGRLRKIGFPIKVRYSGGKDRLSGCGQLGRALMERGDVAPKRPRADVGAP
jgi:23S rRNA (adenine2503-C2)-methyltransferase